MSESPDPSALLYDSARAALDRGDLVEGLVLLEQSLAHGVHFKTLELIGEVRSRLGHHREAVVPLAAATTLNRGGRAACLLAEAFLALGAWPDARDAADESLRRTPGYRRARAARDRADRELANAGIPGDGDD